MMKNTASLTGVVQGSNSVKTENMYIYLWYQIWSSDCWGSFHPGESDILLISTLCTRSDSMQLSVTCTCTVTHLLSHYDKNTVEVVIKHQSNTDYCTSLILSFLFLHLGRNNVHVSAQTYTLFFLSINFDFWNSPYTQLVLGFSFTVHQLRSSGDGTMI